MAGCLYTNLASLKMYYCFGRSCLNSSGEYIQHLWQNLMPTPGAMLLMVTKRKSFALSRKASSFFSTNFFFVLGYQVDWEDSNDSVHCLHTLTHSALEEKVRTGWETDFDTCTSCVERSCLLFMFDVYFTIMSFPASLSKNCIFVLAML